MLGKLYYNFMLFIRICLHLIYRTNVDLHWTLVNIEDPDEIAHNEALERGGGQYPISL